ncbi:MAG: hypothetical protein R3324_21080, partial [Halobacteriales archaeon]|nr:hypothetical protein [Halobacteriales archaeon]
MRTLVRWPIVLGALYASPLLAAQPEPPPCSERLDRLSFMKGRWSVSATEPTGPAGRSGTATVTPIVAGCALQEQLRFADGHEATRIVSFDEPSGTWQLAVVDSGHGNLLLLEGHETETGLEFITTHQRANTLLVDRVTLARTDSGWASIIETATRYGGEWRLLERRHYTSSGSARDPRSQEVSGRPEASDGPAPRAHHQLHYHAGEDRAYLIGGSTRSDGGYRYFSDVWTWTGTSWVRDA